MHLPLIAANWKMNPIPAGALDAGSAYHPHKDVEVVVFPSFIDIKDCVAAKLNTGGQCGRSETAGAFTGDISMQMVKNAGCTYVLCGHSDRRRYHEESDEQIALQVETALAVGLKPVLCIGETWDEYELRQTELVLDRQLKRIKPDARLTIAYEPVWAIGTGNTPTVEEVTRTHAYIRSIINMTGIRILYGGSLNAKNAKEILSAQGMDGALIGGASLKPQEFATIIKAAS